MRREKSEPMKETHIIIEYGRSVTIPCRVKGSPFPVVDWTSDHMEISRDHSEIIYYNNQGDLKINKADRSLNGEYICHAKNVAGHSMMKINIEVISGKFEQTNHSLEILLLYLKRLRYFCILMTMNFYSLLQPTVLLY